MTPLPPITLREVLRATLPAMEWVSYHSQGMAGWPRRRAYAKAYHRRVMREVDATYADCGAYALSRPASPALVCLSSRLIDVSVTLQMGETA